MDKQGDAMNGNQFDFENVLCGECSYPLDDEGHCVIDVDHRGILPSGDETRDEEAATEQRRLVDGPQPENTGVDTDAR